MGLVRESPAGARAASAGHPGGRNAGAAGDAAPAVPAPAAPRPAAPGPSRRRGDLGAALRSEPLLTDAELARRLGCSVQTVRLDRLALGIPDVRHRARTMAERQLRGPGAGVRGDVVDVRPGVRAVAVLRAASEELAPSEAGRDPALFASAEALALAASGIDLASVAVVNVKFSRPPGAGGGSLFAVADVLRGRGSGDALRRVVLVQIRAGDRPVLRAKFVVRSGAGGAPAPQAGAGEA